MTDQPMTDQPMTDQTKSTETKTHDHSCHCGTASPNIGTPHQIGQAGCVRRLVAAPVLLSKGGTDFEDRWLVGDADGQPITGFTLFQQRGYFQHPCGCWSNSQESSNSIAA